MNVDTVGTDTEVPMDDWVEIGVFAAEEDERLGEPLYLRMHRVRSGEQTITVAVDREPGFAGIDPHHWLIDLTMDDNTAAIRLAP